jgi:hypothetical protein
MIGDAPVGRRDDVLPALLLVAGEQRDIGHPLELHVGPGLRVGASVAPGRLADLLVVPVEPQRLLPGGLVVHEDAVLDDVESLGLHPFVVPAAGRERAGLGAIAPDFISGDPYFRVPRTFSGGKTKLVPA